VNRDEAVGAPVQIANLTVTYGSSRGISDVTLDVPQGLVTGVLGPNGSGKSTLIRAILDLVHPSSGEIRIHSLSSRNPTARARVSYLPGDLVLPSRLTGHAVLDRYTSVRGSVDQLVVAALAERLGIDLTRQVGQLSKGNRQKIGLVLAFATDADVLLLDEPTSGLDPLLQREFGELVHEAISRGATVLLSSHVLQELEHLADQVAVLRDGRLIALETIGDLRSRIRQSLIITFASHSDAHVCAQGLDGDHELEIEVDGSVLKAQILGAVDPLIKAIARFHVVSVTSGSADLESIFLEYYGSGGGAE
jgi:ABC-2 type transport system ATP-binding protein